jgi:hypothetical protein
VAPLATAATALGWFGLLPSNELAPWLEPGKPPGPFWAETGMLKLASGLSTLCCTLPGLFPTREFPDA